MAVIFKNLSKEMLAQKLSGNVYFKKAFKFIKENKIAVKLVSICVVGLLSLIISIAATGITFGFEVKCSGKIIATVQNRSVLESAKSIAVKNVSGKAVNSSIATPKLTLILTSVDRLDNADKVANAIIENSGDIVEGFALVVDGEIVACARDDEFSQLLENRRTAFYIAGAENSASFVQEVEIQNGYYLKSKLTDIATVAALINNLQVETVSRVATNITVPFKCLQVKSSSYSLGYSKVTTAGKNGVNRKTEEVVTVNGTESSRKELSIVEISSPVDQVTTIGTAQVKISAADRANIASSGFICPLPSGRFQISSYYGDGRNHKGMDLAANKGVPIYAVGGGKVTYAGYDGDYGYNVIIDHSTGIKTRYAHASALCVSKGQTVSRGEMIAAVGNTGYSTGNHLHFEVIVNGNRVNPAPYIGLN